MVVSVEVVDVSPGFLSEMYKKCITHSTYLVFLIMEYNNLNKEVNFEFEY